MVVNPILLWQYTIVQLASPLKMVSETLDGTSKKLTSGPESVRKIKAT